MIPFLLSMFGIARSVATAVLTWLSKRSVAELACIALGIACLGLFVANRAEKQHSAKVEAQLIKCSQARHADQEAYGKAQADAQAKNLADLAHVKQQQQEVSGETVALLNSNIARLRRELQQPAAPQSAPVKPGLSASGQGASGTAGEARLCLSSEELLSAAESEERHDRLIDWVEKQSAIDPNKGTNILDSVRPVQFRFRTLTAF